MFSRFPNLPLEIQLLIWDAAIDSIGPRVLSFEQWWLWKRMNKIPSLLHTCQDSRSQALKQGYEWVTTALDHSNSATRPPSPDQVYQEDIIPELGCYINYTKDILMVQYGSLFPEDTEIGMWPSAFYRIVKPAKRIMTFKCFSRFAEGAFVGSDHDWFWEFFRPYIGYRGERTKVEEIFILAADTMYKGSGHLFAKLALREDFVQLMEREGMGWVRSCKSETPEWHGNDEKCCNECRMEFEDGRPAIQAIDFGKWWRKKKTNGRGRPWT